MKSQKDLSENSKYKLGFYILLVVLAIILVVGGINFYGTAKFNEGVLAGQSDAVFTIASSAATNGFITLQVAENQSITLVPSQVVEVAQQQVVQQIIQSVAANGFVTVFDEGQEIYLVQATPQTQEDAS